jgi:hypothetical protein
MVTGYYRYEHPSRQGRYRLHSRPGPLAQPADISDPQALAIYLRPKNIGAGPLCPGPVLTNITPALNGKRKADTDD